MHFNKLQNIYIYNFANRCNAIVTRDSWRISNFHAKTREISIIIIAFAVKSQDFREMVSAFSFLFRSSENEREKVNERISRVVSGAALNF